MRKKILLCSLIFLMPILFTKTYAYDMSVNITDVLADNYVNQETPTVNYGTSTEVRIRDTSLPKAYRWYSEINISSLPINVSIVDSEICYLLTSDTPTANVSVYELYSWGGVNETNMIWSNQPCDTGFDNTTVCNLTAIDEQDSTGLGFHCWNVTEPVIRAYTNNSSSVYLAWKTPETEAYTSDRYWSREGFIVPYLYVAYETDIALVNETNLSLTFDDFFAIGEQNLVQANYTIYNDSLPVINATCYFNSTTGEANMTYNETTTQYEIYVIPDVSDIGIIEFNVNCSKIELETQTQIQEYYSGVFAGTLYNITVGLFENLNATTPYIDEFAYIMLHAKDYNCTIISGYEECWRINEYTNGIAYINDTVAIGNFSIYFYSGSVTQSCAICPPIYETFTNLKDLGDFYFNENRTTLYLYVSAAELNWEREILEWVLTRGVAIIGLAIALLAGGTLAMIMFAKGGQNIAVSIATFLVTVWIIIVFIEITFGVDLGLTSIMNLILP